MFTDTFPPSAGPGQVARLSVTVPFSSFTALGNGVTTYSKNLGGVLPSSAVLVGAWISGVGYDNSNDPGGTTVGLEIGTGGDPDRVGQSTIVDQLANSVLNPGFGLMPGGGGGMQSGVLGLPMAPLGGLQLICKFTGSGQLKSLDTGSITVVLGYLP